MADDGDDEKKNDDGKVEVVEFHVSMHCNACERTVAKTISKFKGVETFMTDTNNHKVVVRGNINPKKLLKKLNKKTGKKVEILEKQKEEEGNKCDNDHVGDNAGNVGPEGVSLSSQPIARTQYPCSYNYQGFDMATMFSDENPNACCAM